MAQAPVTKPQFPDVPQSSGVPSIFRDPTAPVFGALLLVADVLTVFRMFEGPQWGIFTSGGGPAVVPDSVITVDFRREWSISDYPVEQGGFESYNKVARPYEARVRMTCDGQTTPRVLFLSQLDTIAQSMDLFWVVTPDAVYTSVNVTHYDYRRERQGGVGIIIVDVWLQEVRVTVESKFASTKDFSSATSVDQGTVQPVDSTSSQETAAQTPGIPLDHAGSPTGTLPPSGANADVGTTPETGTGGGLTGTGGVGDDDDASINISASHPSATNPLGPGTGILTPGKL